jgi:hypothetical protein
MEWEEREEEEESDDGGKQMEQGLCGVRKEINGTGLLDRVCPIGCEFGVKTSAKIGLNYPI